MQYNVLENSLATVNTTVGDITIGFNALTTLLEYNNYPVIHITSSGILSIDFDLGLRLHLDRMDYKFEASNTTSGIAVSDISFQYKNDAMDAEYISLSTCVSDEPYTYYTSFSGSAIAPRFLRLIHTFTTVTGSLYGIRVLNNDGVVDFGTDGTESERNIEVIRNNIENIEEVAVYNNGTSIADAYIHVEPTFTELDRAFSIGLTSTGPWVYTIDEDYMVVDATSWDYGMNNGGEIESSSNELIIPGFEDVNGYYTSMYESVSYETKIFKKTAQDYLHIVVDRPPADDGNIIVDSDDSCDTIYIRSNNAPPKAYSVYRKMYTSYSSNTHYLSFKDVWLENDVVKYTAPSTSFLSTDRYKDFNRFSCIFDKDTDRCAGYVVADSNSGNTYGQTWLFNNLSESGISSLLISTNNTRPANQVFELLDIKLDSSGGMWVYLYSVGYSTSDWCDATGYFIAYFDNTFTEQFKWYEFTKQVSSIAVDYTNNYLWYTNISSNTIHKINTTGQSVVEYHSEEHTQSLGGIDVFPDGSIIYSNACSLYRLGSDGTENSGYDLEDVVGEDITYIVLDGDGSEAVWVCNGTSINRVYLSGSLVGTVDFSVAVTDMTRATSVYGGLWVTCFNSTLSDSTNTYYISKENRRVEYTKTFSAGSPGLQEIGYTDLKYVEQLPIDTDLVWKDLPWQKINLNNYLSSEDRYYQAKIVLRRQKAPQRYDFIDSDVTFVNDDSFIQESVVPKRQLWGSWNDCPDTSRIYVDTTNNELIMGQPTGSIEDAYIRTKERLVTSKNSSDKVDVRVKYRFGDGNTGFESGVAEYIYLYGYAVDTSNAGEYICAYLYIHPEAETNISRIYTGINGSWSNNTLTNNLNLYEGTLRLYGNNNNYLYGQVAEGDSTSFVGNSRSGWQQAGTHWYWQIVVNKSSSQLQIENFEVRTGNNYYYTETPRVRGIYTQEPIKLESIAPQNSKNMYLRIQVSQTASIASDCEADVKVRWRVPIQ